VRPAVARYLRAVNRMQEAERAAALRPRPAELAAVVRAARALAGAYTEVRAVRPAAIGRGPRPLYQHRGRVSRSLPTERRRFFD
jgi:hypothetical protein